LFNTASAALAKAFRVSRQWVDAAFIKSHLGLYWYDQFEVRSGCESKTGDLCSSFDWPSQFEEQFAASAPHILTGFVIVIPKPAYAFLFTHD
jgi:hypothetical protein